LPASLIEGKKDRPLSYHKVIDHNKEAKILQEMVYSNIFTKTAEKDAF